MERVFRHDSLFHLRGDLKRGCGRFLFYVLDLKRDREGVLSYTVAIRSLDGAGPNGRGVRLLPSVGVPKGKDLTSCRFPLFNTGRAAPARGRHPEGVSACLKGDVYRLSASVEGRGWTASLPNELATADSGGNTLVTVNALRAAKGGHLAKVTLTATSQSDPSKRAKATCLVLGR